MTKLLSKAFESAASLPENLQDEVAEQLLEDIQGELLWDDAFAKSQKELGKMADKALEEYKAGKTKKAGFDDL